MDWTQCYTDGGRSLFEKNQKLNVYIGETILACTSKVLQKLACAGVPTVFFCVFADAEKRQLNFRVFCQWHVIKNVGSYCPQFELACAQVVNNILHGADNAVN